MEAKGKTITRTKRLLDRLVVIATIIMDDCISITAEYCLNRRLLNFPCDLQRVQTILLLTLPL